MRRRYTVQLLWILILSIAFAFEANAQMEFVENKGQWHSNVQYKGDFNSGALFLEKNGFTMLMNDASDIERLSGSIHGHSHSQKEPVDPTKPVNIRSFVYKMKLLGASNASVNPEKPFPSHNNYYLGNDRNKWASDCKLYQAVTYQNIYPNIDIRYYSDGGNLKYDFIVHPGGNPSRIAMQYDGPDELLVKNRELIIRTPLGEIKELSPYTYYNNFGKPIDVDCKFVVRNNVVTFDVGKYDTKSVLIIDPTIIFSTLSGSTADNWGYSATPGPDGTFYSSGIAFGSGYPVSPGAFQTSYNGGTAEGTLIGYDVAIFKFSSDGRRRIYATYLGGSANEQPHSMIVDPQGDLIITGRTNSGNFPTSSPTIGFGGDFDIFLTKFNANGTALLGSRKIGGSASDGVNIRPKYVGATGKESLRRNYGDDARSEVIVDAANNVILAACSQSPDFPVTPGAVQAGFGGRQDGIVLKMTSNLSTLIFSTFFGGSGDDACFSTDINPISGNIYIGGGTTSNNLPGDKSSVAFPNYQGGETDGFVTIISNDGTRIIKTTYQGTPGADIVYGLKFDKTGFPYIMGTTTGSWRIVNATFSNGGGKQFISKLQPDLSAYVYSTVFGTNSADPNISPIAFLVDRCENVYVSGWGGGINNNQAYSSGTTAGMQEVNPLPSIPAADGSDFYFFVLERNATRQLFGSHFGQSGGVGDHVDGGTSRFDANGVIYQAMCANCGGRIAFPTTPGAWSSRNNAGSGCNQASVKIEMNFAGVGSAVQSSINGVVNKRSGCVPLEVTFRDSLNLGKKFYWNFGDGSPVQITTTNNITHTFTTVNVFTVMLISEDSSTCNIRDTSYLTIKTGNNVANLDFNYQKLPPCESLTMQFNNLSTPTTGSFAPNAFIWDFGDRSPREVSGLNPPRTHTYSAPGNYKVTLYLQDTLFCNAPDSISKNVRISPFVKAKFTTSPLGCAPYDAVFLNTSEGGTDFIWNFGDGQTSILENPTHTYPIGTYSVTLIAKDTNTCNKIDTSAPFIIRVVEKPGASFDWSPNPPQENTPVRFQNTSVRDVRYLWNFGDGESSTLENPVHLYNETRTYTAELIVYNEAGCSDTARRDVPVLIVPLLAVPNAFTPGKFGENAVITIKGFGIGKMNWSIYNRWGQLVFQTNSRKQGWDGTYKGKLQPMDVYAYTLDVEFTDGQKVRKTGDITLIR